MMEVLGPSDEHSLWAKPLALQPKYSRDDLLWFEQDEMFYPSVFDSTLSFWFHVFDSRCTLHVS